MTLNCSRIAKEIAMMSAIFCRGQEADIAFFFQETRMRHIRKIFEENWSIIAWNRAIKATNLETLKQIKWIKMHQSQANMYFQRGPPRWLTEKKNPKFLRSLQNAQRDTCTTNLAVRFFFAYSQKINTPESFVVLLFIRKDSTVVYIEG